MKFTSFHLFCIILLLVIWKKNQVFESMSESDFNYESIEEIQQIDKIEFIPRLYPNDKRKEIITYFNDLFLLVFTRLQETVIDKQQLGTLATQDVKVDATAKKGVFSFTDNKVVQNVETDSNFQKQTIDPLQYSKGREVRIDDYLKLIHKFKDKSPHVSYFLNEASINFQVQKTKIVIQKRNKINKNSTSEEIEQVNNYDMAEGVNDIIKAVLFEQFNSQIMSECGVTTQARQKFIADKLKSLSGNITIKNLNIQQQVRVVATCLLKVSNRPSIGERIADTLGYDIIYPPEIIPIEEQIEEEIIEEEPKIISEEKSTEIETSTPKNDIDFSFENNARNIKISDGNEILKLWLYPTILLIFGIIIMLITMIL